MSDKNKKHAPYLSRVPGFREEDVSLSADAVGAAAQHGGGNGGGGLMDDVARRVGVLEQKFDKIDGKLDAILASLEAGALADEKRFSATENRLTGIETKLDTKASTEAVVKIGADLAQRVQAVEKDVGVRATTADVRELNGKVSSIPNFWQTFAIMAGLLVGVSGLAFTISKLAGH